jgi:hypothetical protein
VEKPMGHIIQWDNEEKTVVLQQYTGGAIKDDLYHLAEESAAMLNSVPHTVHLIIDERNVRHNLNSADINYLEKIVPANQGVAMVIVEKSALTYKKMVQDMNKKLAPRAFDAAFFVSTLEEARALLQEQFDVHYP